MPNPRDHAEDLLSQQAVLSLTTGIFQVNPGRPESRCAGACMGMSSANSIMLLLSHACQSALPT